MSDTAPHFIDSAKTDAEDTLNKVADAANQGADTAESAAQAFSDRASDAVQSGTETARQNNQQAFSMLTEVNRAVTEAYSQSLSELNTLTQQALQIRTTKDLVAFHSDAFAQFQRNLAATANIYQIVLQGATQSFSANTTRAQDAFNAFRKAA